MIVASNSPFLPQLIVSRIRECRSARLAADAIEFYDGLRERLLEIAK